MSRPRRQPVAAYATLLLTALLAFASGAAVAKEKLVAVEPNQVARTDNRGFTWDPQRYGFIADGTNDCFDNASMLKVNAAEFRTTKPILKTEDDQEFIFEGGGGTIGIVRRLRVHADLGAVRYTEIITNRGKRRQNVTIEIISTLGKNVRTLVTNRGRAVAPGPLKKGETSLFAINHSTQGRPSVIFHLRGPNTSVTPKVHVQSNRTFTVTYTLSVPAGKTVAIMHGLAQRRFAAPPALQPMAAEIKPFLAAGWTDGLPSGVRSAIVNQAINLAAAEGLTQALPAHQEVLRLAKAYGLTLGEQATVFIERDKPLEGQASGKPLKVRTRMGEATVPFDDVAILRGGAGVGRSMRLFLRNGEILAGDVEAPDLVFKTTSGLEIPLTPRGIDALFLPAAERDGVVGNDMEAFLTQLDGTKVSLQPSSGVMLAAVSPWGDLAIALDEVVRLRHARDPLPGLWVLLRDGSRFPLAVRGDAWKLGSTRFGPVEVAPGSIAAWSRHGVAPTLHEAEGDDEMRPVDTHAKLVGDCFLVGQLADASLTLETIAGEAPVEVATIRSLERGDDTEGGRPTFALALTTGETLEGRIVQPLVSFQTPRGTCRVPVMHLWSYRMTSKPAEPVAPPDDAPKDDAPKDDASKDDDPKDEAQKADAPRGTEEDK